MDMRAVDPGPCRVAHIVRGVDGEMSARQIGRVWFVRDDIVRGEDGLNTGDGWQEAETVAKLSDDGTFTLVLPNVAGVDGVLHRRRFAVLTDRDYEPGEEWLEFWSDFDQERPFFVGTPTDYEKTKSTVTITGTDLLEVLNGSLSSDVDAWDPIAPADVLRHYSRLATLAYAADEDDAVVVGSTVAVSDVAADCWICEARVRFADTEFLAAPEAVASVENGDGTINNLAAGTYHYSVTAIVGGIETPPSAETTVVLASGGRSIRTTWTAVMGATGYRVYRRTAVTPGNAPGTGYTSIAAGVTSYNDIGIATSSGIADASDYAAGAPPARPTVELQVAGSASAPTGVASGSNTSGVINNLQQGTYHYSVAAIVDGVETPASTETTVVLASGGKSIQTTWTAVPGATAYRIYRRAGAACDNGPAMGFTVVGAVTSFNDIGLPTSSGTAGASDFTVGVAPSRAIVASVSLDADDGSVSLTGGTQSPILAKAHTVDGARPANLALRLVARYDRIFAFIDGELLAECRRPAPWGEVAAVAVENHSTGMLTIEGLQVETLADFAGRGNSAVIDRNLPGLPSTGGLRGRYWNAAGIYARYSDFGDRGFRLFPLSGDADPVVDRLDSTVDFPVGTNNYPPNLPGAYAARWSGAIYLDLETGDRKLRLTGLVGNARLYVGRTLRGDEAASSWVPGAAAGATPLTSDALRSWLGTSASGWYPIVIEQAHGSAQAGIVLEDTALDDGGSPVGWATVPMSRLSPIGCYEDLVRLTPHRTLLGDIAQTFGYQWRCEHRSLESGEFPGQLTFRTLVGRQTSVVVDDDQVGSDATVQGAARDVVDGIAADAAGIADPTGSGQLTAETIDYDRAREHMALRKSYESLSDITEAQLLATRIDSLLALRSSPNEQVGVRPRGQIDLVDTFQLSGELAKMKWEPGDGVLLQLDSVDVFDESPRQLTSITWSPRPDGLGVPTVGFRQRPHSFAATMKRLRAAIYGPRRTYQGSRAISTGTPGGTTGTVDGYSRAPLPTSLDDVARVVAVVQSISGSGWRLEVAGTDLGTPGAVNAVGRYDITGAAKAAARGTPYVYARLVGGGGSYLMTLEVTVRV